MRTFLLALFLAALVTAQQPAPAKTTNGGGAIVTGAVGRKLDEMVHAFGRPSGGFCGSVLVAKKGEVLLEKGYGLADAATGKPIGRDAMWDWASVSKQFTAAALLKLQDEKRLALDDALTRFYPDAPQDKSRVTLRQLLTHTSGIQPSFARGTKYDATRREAFEALALDLPMVAEPGTKYAYSNVGYILAAAVVERVVAKTSGKTFDEYCITELFRPAGMTDACCIGWRDLDVRRVPRVDRGKGFVDEPKSRHFAYGDELGWGYRGCGGVVATTRDLLHWDRALRGGKLLSPAAIAELYEPALDGYGLGWRVRNDGGFRVEHGGSVRGVLTHYLRRLDDDVVVAIACSFVPKEPPELFATRLANEAKN